MKRRNGETVKRTHVRRRTSVRRRRMEERSEQDKKRHALCGESSELRFQPRLFAQLVCCNAIKYAVTLYRNSLLFVRVNGMAAALAEKIKTMFYKIFNKITSFNRHYQFQPLPAQIRQPQQAILDPFVDRPVSFHEGHLLRIDDNLQKISLQLQLRAIQSIDPCTLIGVWYISQYSF